MNKFEILKVNDFKYNSLIVTNSFDTPFSNLKEIANELLSRGIHSGYVIFDLLLITGNTNDRFVEAEVCEGEFIDETFKNIEISKKSDLRYITMNLLKNEMLVLEASMLNNAQKMLIRSGRVI